MDHLQGVANMKGVPVVPSVATCKVPTSPPFTAFLGNLPYDVQEVDIAYFFRQLKVHNVHLPRDNGEKGRIRGFGYATFGNRQDLIQALALNNEVMKNRAIKVSLAVDHVINRSGGARYNLGGGDCNRDSYNNRREDKKHRDSSERDFPPKESVGRRPPPDRRPSYDGDMTSSVKKCILKNDHQSLISLDASSSVKQETIKVATGNLPENISCPPKPLKSENDNQMLSEVGFAQDKNFTIQFEECKSNVKMPLTLKNEKSKEDRNGKEEKKVNVMQAQSPANVGIALTSSSGIMMRIVVPADNSCLFTSLYFITHAGQVNVTEVSKLRKVVARGIKKRPEKYNRAILGISNEEYQKWILDSASWGGEIELEVISASFRLEICAIDIIRCQMHRFGESYNYNTRCFLVHDGIHYDPLVMQYEDRMETLFTCRDNHVIDLAMEVAKEAQSSRQFTDTQNFKLRCMVCGERLIGNKEASAHAKTTGHANYEELKS